MIHIQHEVELYEYGDRATLTTLAEYNEDFIKVSREREQKRKPFFHVSEQLQYRGYLITRMNNICREKYISRTSLYLAVYFLDLWMDNFVIPTRSLWQVAITSILMAAKIEENLSGVPSYNAIMPIDERTEGQYNQFEMEMLSFFDWDLIIPTPAHHIPYFMQAILTDDEKRRATTENIIYSMNRFMDFYMTVLLHDAHLLENPSPSKVAAGLVSLCRKRFGYSAWNDDLKRLTQYEPADFQEVVDRVSRVGKLDCVNCLKIPPFPFNQPEFSNEPTSKKK